MSLIGILGGSFDPIHLGHVLIINKAIKDLNLDKFLVIPTCNNPWKDSTYTTINHRLKMIDIALKDIEQASIDYTEINSKSDDKNYTIDTILELKKKYQNDQLFFVMGMDQASKFHLWKDADKISKLVKLVVFDRIGYEVNDNIDKFNFIKLDIIASDISSTEIRNGEIDNLNPEVLSYIVNNGIYLETIIKSKMSLKRYEHTKSMAILARDIAFSNGLDETKAYVAGMLHDIAKEMDIDQATKLMKLHYPLYLDYPKPVWHQWLSAFLAKHVYFINDDEILQAIRHHTTGSLYMSKLDKCIYVADKYDPYRDYDSSKEIELCKKDINAGFKQCIIDSFDYFNENNQEINDEFLEIYKKYTKEK